jgi:hypothetical protein
MPRTYWRRAPERENLCENLLRNVIPSVHGPGGPPIAMKVTALVTPAKAGVHFSAGELDSRFRGTDVTFDGAQRRISAVRSR